MKVGVVTFPGSLDDVDARRAARLAGAEAVALWHGDHDLQGVDAVVEFAAAGGLVFGICNGFQVLCEAHLLPGALLPNANRRFTARQVQLEVVTADTPFTRACEPGQRLSIPAKHSWGRYHADEQTLERMRAGDQIVVRYAPGENFNGSVQDIAGVCNEQRNVFGLMPHPEHAVDELVGGSADGLRLFESVRLAGANGPAGQAAHA